MSRDKIKNSKKQNKNYQNLPYYPITNNNGYRYIKDNSY